MSPVAEEAVSDFSVQPFPMSQNGSYSEISLSASLQNDKAQPQAESLMGQERKSYHLVVPIPIFWRSVPFTAAISGLISRLVCIICLAVHVGKKGNCTVWQQYCGPGNLLAKLVASALDPEGSWQLSKDAALLCHCPCHLIQVWETASCLPLQPPVCRRDWTVPLGWDGVWSSHSASFPTGADEQQGQGVVV